MQSLLTILDWLVDSLVASFFVDKSRSLDVDIFMFVENITQFLKSESRVGAAWLEGSYARGENDEYSDIDFWVDCEDGFEENLLVGVTDFLSKKSNAEVRSVHNYFQDHPQILQYYIFVGEQIIDLCIQSRSRSEDLYFDKNEEVKVLFDKLGLLKFSNEVHSEFYDDSALDEQINWIWAKSQVVIKKASRGNFFVALDGYHRLLENVIEYYLCKNRSKKSYLVYKDLKHLNLDRQVWLKSLYEVTNCEQIITNLEWIHKEFENIFDN